VSRGDLLDTPPARSGDRADSDIADVIIVGAGPVGLFGAFYAGMRGLSTVVVDALDEPGGQVAALYPERDITDVPGFPRIKGRDLISALVTQTEPFQPRYELGRTAVLIERSSAGTLRMTLSDHTSVQGRSVLLAAGVGAFKPRPLPGAEHWAGRGVSYFVSDPAAFADKRVVVVGGGDSAVDWAHALVGTARTVDLVHRRDTFRAHRHSVDQLRRTDVTMHLSCGVEAVFGDATITGVRLSRADGGQCELPCDAIIAALGFIANPGPLLDWGLETDSRRIVVDRNMQTSLPAIFAAGDICTFDGRIPLIATGFGEVATAVNHAAAWLDPTASIFPGHSTDTVHPVSPEEVPVR
jgi:ferredoxin/flavodoxin---NADP+ reductase